MEWKDYKKAGTTEMVTYQEFINLVGKLPSHVSVSDADLENGSPKKGDMIARNPNKPEDMWLVSQEYFEENYVEVGRTE